MVPALATVIKFVNISSAVHFKRRPSFKVLVNVFAVVKVVKLVNEFLPTMKASAFSKIGFKHEMLQKLIKLTKAQAIQNQTQDSYCIDSW